MTEPKPEEFSELVARISNTLTSLKIPSHLTGDLVTSYYGDPRFTQDIDIVVHMDQGYRRDPSGIADCDGDGVSDAQEIIDGTGVCDPGSFQLHLKSPAFTKYNTFLNQFNFLELTASGTETIEAEVIVYSIGGEVISTKAYSIPSGQQEDIDIHSDIIPLAPNGTFGRMSQIPLKL